jgi:hypothetical protein
MGSHVTVVSYRNRKTLQNIEDPDEFTYKNGLSLELQVVLHFQSGNKLIHLGLNIRNSLSR